MKQLKSITNKGRISQNGELKYGITKINNKN